MPAKHVIKEYVAKSYYHVYSRGANKQQIFHDEQDVGVFLSYLKTYLSPKNEARLNKIISDPTVGYKERNEAIRLLKLNNFSDAIDLVCYCLMPNHFHFLLRQKGERDMKAMMQSLLTRYTMYINSRHKSVGPLFQSNYKAVRVTSDAQLLYLTRYIHRNHFSLKRSDLLRLLPSSLPNYLGKLRQGWIKPDEILSHFSSSGFTSYESFVSDGSHDEKMVHMLMYKQIDND